MIIGFDAKRAMNNFTGLGNYSRLVIESIAKEYPDDKSLCFVPSMRHNPRLNTLRELKNVKWVTPSSSIMRALPRSVWRTWGIPSQAQSLGVNIYHGLSNELPLNINSSGVKSVVTIHDLIYRRLPYCYKPADRLLYDWKYGTSCRIATRIIAISEATRRDIMEIYGIPESRIDVIYQGCDDSFRIHHSEQDISDTLHIYGIDSPYMVQVGTVERRKNLELTLRALAALPREYDNVKLAVIGRGKEYRTKMQTLAAELGIKQRVIWLDTVPFAHLPALCQGAKIILYPSHYEGFGIPVLEGLESRRPVIAANTSSLPEAGGEAALYVDPFDVVSMREAMESILSGSADTGGMIEKGLRHARQFNTSSMATKIMDTYLRALCRL